MLSYESAGTWRDTEGETCLVIQADYGEDEGPEVRAYAG